MRILLCRTDNIGDLVLTLPVAELIKQNHPECEVWFLVREYTAPIFAAATGVDGWLSWDRLSSLPEREAAQEIKAQNFDVSVQVHPNRHASRLLWKARVPKRIGTWRRLYHLLHCNRWVNLSRSGSPMHEGLLNTQLMRGLFPDCVKNSLEELPLPKLVVDKPCDKVETILDTTRKTIILHPGSHGHGREWATSRWEKLAAKLDQLGYQVLITGSSQEAERFADLKTTGSVQNIMGRLSLEELLALIARSHGLVAGSTGPVHMAGALAIHALALQSSSPTRGPWRWKPLGEKAEYLSIIPSCKGGCTQESCPCIEAIEVQHVLERISKW